MLISCHMLGVHQPKDKPLKLSNTVVILSMIILTSCSSYRNANIDGFSVLGGGFTDRRVTEGLYYVEVRSGVSPISNLGGVEKNWQKRATDLCTGEFDVFDYVAFDVKQPYSYNSPGGLAYDYYIRNNVRIRFRS